MWGCCQTLARCCHGGDQAWLPVFAHTNAGSWFQVRFLAPLCRHCLHDGIYSTALAGFAACEQGSVPWHASLSLESHVCSGALISAEWVLAPAQCYRRWVWLVKNHSQTHHKELQQLNLAAKLIPHEQFNNCTLDFDIMLIKLMYPADTNEFVAPIHLPSQCAPTDRPCAFADGSVSLLQCTDLPIASEATCSRAYPGRFTDRMLCAGQLDSSQETCKGDVGSPLACDGVLQGLLSWAKSCNEENHLGLYTKVCDFQDWIKFTVANN
uniref:Peptidase S1 domain-containing protein n=1 Tax=Salvator merianae TaxID=96440 RepID=A0A8D0C9Z9_SALMN